MFELIHRQVTRTRMTKNVSLCSITKVVSWQNSLGRTRQQVASQDGRQVAEKMTSYHQTTRARKLKMPDYVVTKIVDKISWGELDNKLHIKICDKWLRKCQCATSSLFFNDFVLKFVWVKIDLQTTRARSHDLTIHSTWHFLSYQWFPLP